MTATSPLTAMMAFRMPVMRPGRALSVPLQPAASRTAWAAPELHTSVACAMGVKPSRESPSMLIVDRIMILEVFDFMRLL